MVWRLLKRRWCWQGMPRFSLLSPLPSLLSGFSFWSCFRFSIAALGISWAARRRTKAPTCRYWIHAPAMHFSMVGEILKAYLMDFGMCQPLWPRGTEVILLARCHPSWRRCLMRWDGGDTKCRLNSWASPCIQAQRRNSWGVRVNAASGALRRSSERENHTSRGALVNKRTASEPRLARGRHRRRARTCRCTRTGAVDAQDGAGQHCWDSPTFTQL